MSWLNPLVLSLAVIQALQGIVLLILLRQVGILSLRVRPAGAKTMPSGPVVGELVPHLTLPDMGGTGLTLQLPPPDEKPWIVLFVAPGCSSCQHIAPAIRSLSGETGDELGWAIVCMGRRSECIEFRDQRSFGRSLFCYAADEIRDLYEIGTTPYALLIGPDGNLIAKGLVNHIEHIESMINAAREGRLVRSSSS